MGMCYILLLKILLNGSLLQPVFKLYNAYYMASSVPDEDN